MFEQIGGGHRFLALPGMHNLHQDSGHLVVFLDEFLIEGGNLAEQVALTEGGHLFVFTL